jgi:hypothetical protein
MIVLDVQQETAGAVYFDIHHLQVQKSRKEPCYLIAGTLGDGWYEGEVSVTFDAEMEVTFVDEWMDRSSLAEFFGRVKREDICAALSGILKEAIGCLPSFKGDSAGGEGIVRSVSCYKKRMDHGAVSEGLPQWIAA